MLWRDHTASVKTITKNLEENWSQTSTNKRYLYFILGVFILLEIMLWVNEQLSICLIFLRLVRMLLTNIHFYCGKCIKVSVKYLISMFKWTLAASMFWSSQILKGEFHWLSCDTVQRGETKRMLRCCNIGKLFISFLDQRWNLTCLSISSLSIIEATFKAQSIQEFNVLPEVAKILKNLLRLEKECRLTDCKGTMCEIFACSAYCLL